MYLPRRERRCRARILEAPLLRVLSIVGPPAHVRIPRAALKSGLQLELAGDASAGGTDASVMLVMMMRTAHRFDRMVLAPFRSEIVTLSLYPGR